MRFLLILTLLPLEIRAESLAPPQAVDSSTQITLLAEHSNVHTPTGVDVDGRIYVLENNTHFRPDNYPAPELKSDRILIFTDPGDGTPAGPPTVFYEGLIWGTDLVISSSGWIYASTRKEIFRMRDTDGDGVADDIRGVIDLDTKNDYPHNGISGLCFDTEGNLSFGLGENHGTAYTITGSDGTRITGGDEGGCTFRCTFDGSELQRITTGLWNPFGMDYHSAGNLFATDNDPGSSPPNRLLHIVEGADYGFEFRSGRSGLHPLVSWTGDFPGTTKMVTGIGEAACGILAFGSNQLIISSWAEDRVDRYELSPKGATFAATRHPFIRGSDDFRPIDIAMASDRQTFYITDWVSGSYPVHGQGRLWRIRLELPIPPTNDEPHSGITHAASIRKLNGVGNIPGLVQLLDDDDPQIRNASIHALASIGSALQKNLPTSFLKTPRQKVGALVALKRTGDPTAHERISAALKDPHPDVRFTAVKWVADEKLEEFRPQLKKLLADPRLDTHLFLGVMAAIDRLDGKKPSDIPATVALKRFAADSDAPPSLRATALALIPPEDFDKLPINYFKPLLIEESATLRLEAIRSLASHPDTKRGPLLAAISDAPTTASRIPEQKPSPAEPDAWLELLGDEPGDPDIGRRLFFHPKVGTCASCHRMEGRGTRVGPDLTTTWKCSDTGEDPAVLQRWLLESIFTPSASLAPQFLPWQIDMADGSAHIGLPLRRGGNRETYLGIDGREFSLKKPEIKTHRELPVSLMPVGLLEQLTLAEARDLLAYLMEPK